MARYVCKNVVASGLADKCTLQVAYAIGVAEPVSLMVFTDKTSKVSEDRIVELIKKHFDMTPQAYLKAVRLDKARRFLRKGSYATVAQAARECGFGHMSKFATDYRIQFDELPSDTLRRTRLRH